MKVRSQLHAMTALPPQKGLLLCQELHPGSSSPQHSHYIDYANKLRYKYKTPAE